MDRRREGRPGCGQLESEDKDRLLIQGTVVKQQPPTLELPAAIQAVAGRTAGIKSPWQPWRCLQMLKRSLQISAYSVTDSLQLHRAANIGGLQHIRPLPWVPDCPTTDARTSTFLRENSIAGNKGSSKIPAFRKRASSEQATNGSLGLFPPSDPVALKFAGIFLLKCQQCSHRSRIPLCCLHKGRET